jgi:hypothetical protein
MVGISNFYIESILNKFHLPIWDGVLSCDQIEFTFNLLRDFILVVNFAKSTQEGIHFVCVFQIREKLYLFDSLATPDNLLPQPLKKLMTTKRGSKILEFPIQHLFSEYCGFYCIYCVLWLSLPKEEQRAHFSPTTFSRQDLFSNDTLCISYIVKMIRILKTRNK